MSWTVLQYGSSGLRPADAVDPLSNSYSLLYEASSVDPTLGSLGSEDPDSYLRFARSVMKEDPPEIPYQRQLLSDNYRRRVTQLYTYGTPIPNHSGLLNTDVFVDSRESAMYEKMRKFDAAWMPRLTKFGDNMLVDSSGQESTRERIEAERFVPQNIRLPEDDKVAQPMGYSGNRFHNPQGLAAREAPAVDLVRTDLTNALTGYAPIRRDPAQAMRGLSDRRVEAPGRTGESTAPLGRSVFVSGRADRSALRSAAESGADPLPVLANSRSSDQSRHQRAHSLLLAEQAALHDSVHAAQIGRNAARRPRNGASANASRYAIGSVAGSEGLAAAPGFVRSKHPEHMVGAANLAHRSAAGLGKNTNGAHDTEQTMRPRALVHGSPSNKLGLDQGRLVAEAPGADSLQAVSDVRTATRAGAAQARDRLQASALAFASPALADSAAVPSGQRARGGQQSAPRLADRALSDSAPSGSEGVQSSAALASSRLSRVSNSSARKLQRVEPFSTTPFFYDYSFSSASSSSPARILRELPRAVGVDRPSAEFQRTDVDNYRASVRLDNVYRSD